MLTLRGQGFPISTFQSLTVTLLGDQTPEPSRLDCPLATANASAVTCLTDPYPPPGNYTVLLAANSKKVRPS